MCPFCLEMTRIPVNYHDEQYQSMVAKGSTIIMMTHSFVILPDFGPILIGHALIIPKRHVTSFACLSDIEIKELETVIQKVREAIWHNYGLYTEFFEHGSDISLVNSMASVSHAHLHIMPVKSPTDLVPTNMEWKNSNFYSLINDIEAQNDGYLLFCQVDGQIKIAKYEKAISQFFRKYYASINGNQKWNWKNDRNKEMLIKTLDFYSSLRLEI